MKKKNREPNLIVFSKQSYNAMEKNVVSVVINSLENGIDLQPELFEKNKTITVSAKMLNLSKDNYHRLKKVSKSLISKTIEIIDDEKQEFELFVPFPHIKYKKGKLDITMLADVLPHFLELKNGYTEYYLQESLSLKRVETKRLYDLFSSQKKFNNSLWTVYDAHLIELLNISAKSYKGRPAKFEEAHITPKIEEINQKTRLDISVMDRGSDADGWFTTFRIVEVLKEDDFVIKKHEKKLTEKEIRLVEKLEKLNVRKDLIKKILEDEKMQIDSWGWFSYNAEELRNKKFRNPAGVLLTHLGLVKKKK